MKLLETLTHFNGGNSVSELYEKFSEIASVFLYGGYIDVNNMYKIYIKTVEFYFHSEAENGVHDPIVYHRNKNEQEIPYFPLMTIHAHNSGFDITFESESGKYRASALIRSYEVKKGEKYLKWNKNHFEENDKYCFNSQSTYLYHILQLFLKASLVKMCSFLKVKQNTLRQRRSVTVNGVLLVKMKYET